MIESPWITSKLLCDHSSTENLSWWCWSRGWPADVAGTLGHVCHVSSSILNITANTKRTTSPSSLELSAVQRWTIYHHYSNTVTNIFTLRNNLKWSKVLTLNILSNPFNRTKFWNNANSKNIFHPYCVPDPSSQHSTVRETIVRTPAHIHG